MVCLFLFIIFRFVNFLVPPIHLLATILLRFILSLLLQLHQLDEGVAKAQYVSCLRIAWNFLLAAFFLSIDRFLKILLFYNPDKDFNFSAVCSTAARGDSIAPYDKLYNVNVLEPLDTFLIPDYK